MQDNRESRVAAFVTSQYLCIMRFTIWPESATPPSHAFFAQSDSQKLIERVGETLREISHVFTERAHTLKISNIARDTDGVMVSKSSNDLRISGQVLSPFPAELLPGLRDRHAVLCVGCSKHALAYLHDFYHTCSRVIQQPRYSSYGIESHDR
jgi:hypothetical protein